MPALSCYEEDDSLPTILGAMSESSIARVCGVLNYEPEDFERFALELYGMRAVRVHDELGEEGWRATYGDSEEAEDLREALRQRRSELIARLGRLGFEALENAEAADRYHAEAIKKAGRALGKSRRQRVKGGAR